MIKFLLILTLSVVLCSGCSFIVEKFGTKPSQEQNQEHNENQQQNTIPTNPQHS